MTGWQFGARGSFEILALLSPAGLGFCSCFDGQMVWQGQGVAILPESESPAASWHWVPEALP